MNRFFDAVIKILNREEKEKTSMIIVDELLSSGTGK